MGRCIEADYQSIKRKTAQTGEDTIDICHYELDINLVKKWRGAAGATPLHLRLNFSYQELFLRCPHNLGQFIKSGCFSFGFCRPYGDSTPWWLKCSSEVNPTSVCASALLKRNQ